MNRTSPLSRATCRAFRPGLRRSLPKAFVVFAGVAAVGLFSVGRVDAADNTLVSSSPAAGSTVDTSPPSLLLTFANPLGGANDVQVVCGGTPVAVGIAAGEAIGRWGCFFGGCCYGKQTHVAWSVYQHEAYRHPTQIYLSVAAALILIVLLAYERLSPPENALFCFQGLLMCVSRFLIEFYRDSPPAFQGLTTAQWACIPGALFFAIMHHRLTAGSEALIGKQALS